jgi:hypothetical protein
MDISKLLRNMEFYKIRVTNDGEVIVHRCVASEFQSITTLSGKRQLKYLEWYPNGTCERAWGNEDLFDKVLCDRYGRIAFCLPSDIPNVKDKFLMDSGKRLAKKEQALTTERRWQELLPDISIHLMEGNQQ